MKRLWGFLRTLDAGEWVAASVVVAVLVWTVWHTTGNIWNIAVESLQPPLPDRGDLARADVIAQRSMAAAAWWMVFIAGISAIVGALSLFLIARTLQQAKRSADAAEKAVEAAVEASVNSLKMGREQVRAHVSIVGAVLRKTDTKVFGLSFRYTNAGQTPAREIWTSAAIRLTTLGAPGPDDGFVEGQQRSRSDLPPEVERTAEFDLSRLTGGKIWQAEVATSEFCIVCDFGVEYEDVVAPGEKHGVLNRYYCYFDGPLGTGEHVLYRTRPDWEMPIGGGT